MEINQIIAKMRADGQIQTVQRLKKPYTIEDAVEAVKAIGTAMNPHFRIDEENRFVYENMIRWIHADPAMMCLDPETRTIIPGNPDAGIYIAGPTGTGKTFLLDLFALYCKAYSIQVMFNFNQMTRRYLSWSSYRTDQICEEFAQNGTIDRFKKMGVIAFQDFGSEPAESNYMGNRLEVMRQILEYRGDRNDQITLITSNLPIEYESTAARYGDRVVSRLHNLNYFEIKGKDRRKCN